MKWHDGGTWYRGGVKVLHSFWSWFGAKTLKCFREAKSLKFLEVVGGSGLWQFLYLCMRYVSPRNNWTNHYWTDPEFTFPWKPTLTSVCVEVDLSEKETQITWYRGLFNGLFPLRQRNKGGALCPPFKGCQDSWFIRRWQFRSCQEPWKLSFLFFSFTLFSVYFLHSFYCHHEDERGKKVMKMSV